MRDIWYLSLASSVTSWVHRGTRLFLFRTFQVLLPSVLYRRWSAKREGGIYFL